MSEFINSIDVLGDDAVIDSIIDRTITEYNDSSISKVGDFAFYGCDKLVSVNFPSAVTIGTYSFAYCTNLTKADFASVTVISSSAFRDSGKLTALILRNTARVPSLLAADMFNGTPIRSGTGYIYVPAALVDSYTTNWGAYASQIRAIEDYPDICGGE